jgi:uncharacterized protein YutE (UPF0331/DUF86 family)
MTEKKPINIQKIRNILADIESSIDELKILTSCSPEEFIKDKRNYALTEHYLRRALEGILTIGSHLLARLPVKTRDYQEIISSLGQEGILPTEFAERNKKLASYRNRLVHLYWEISPEELYKVVKQHLNDLSQFCSFYKKAVSNRQKFGFDV